MEEIIYLTRRWARLSFALPQRLPHPMDTNQPSHHIPTVLQIRKRKKEVFSRKFNTIQPNHPCLGFWEYQGKEEKNKYLISNADWNSKLWKTHLKQGKKTPLTNHNSLSFPTLWSQSREYKLTKMIKMKMNPTYWVMSMLKKIGTMLSS